jgi:hypothetical protein
MKRWTFLAAALAAGLLGSAAPGAAADWQLSGHVGVETRVFPNEPAFDDQDDTRFSGSVFAEPELRVDFDDGTHQLTLVPFARYDTDDDNRTHADLREANWLWIGDGWDLVVGIDRVFWGVTESRSLVDIVNQVDGVEGIDGDSKLGQPMVNVNVLTDYGTLRLFALPGFRERTFPDDDARLRGPLPIRSNARFGSGAGHDEVALAVRYTNTLGPVDLGLSHFHGTGREPRLLLDTTGGGQPFFQPFYEKIDQTSLDLQLTLGSWLWKLEAMTRSGQGDRINAVVGGLEYTFFGAFGTDADVGLLAEYLYDDRDLDEFVGIGTGLPYDDDIFLGSRVTLNDLAGTQLLAGAIVDRHDGSTAASLEASRRLTDVWRLELEANWFLNVDDDDVLTAIDNDDHIILRLKRFF